MNSTRQIASVLQSLHCAASELDVKMCDEHQYHAYVFILSTPKD